VSSTTAVVLAAVIGELLWRRHRKTGRSDEAEQSLREGFRQLSIYTKWLSSIEHNSLSQEDRKVGSAHGTNAFSAIDTALQFVEDPEVLRALGSVKDDSWEITIAIMQGKQLPDLGPLQSGRSELKRVVKTRMRIKV
jgi:hypothetical protein